MRGENRPAPILMSTLVASVRLAVRGVTEFMQLRTLVHIPVFIKANTQPLYLLFL